MTKCNTPTGTNIVSAIVPAHNEVTRLGSVVSVLRGSRLLSEVIVIDDGSFDGTGEAARQSGAIVLRNESRKGKGQALERGVRQAKGEVLFFCDADIVGLTPEMVERIVSPVLRGDVEMSIGARKSKVRHIGFGHTYSPLLDGQRALTRGLWDRIASHLKTGYKVEVALNYHARTCVHEVFEFSQFTKEKKRGFLRGKGERYLMYADIFLAHVLNRLQVK